MKQLKKQQSNSQNNKLIDAVDNPVEEGISEIIDDEEIGTKEKTDKVMALVRSSSYFSGPLPSPEQLLQYNKLPGVVELITGMAVKEQEHRHKMEESLCQSQQDLNNNQMGYINESLRMKKRHQYFGFVVTIILIVMGIVCLFFNQSMVGLCMFLPAFGAFCGIMFFGNKSEEISDEENKS